MMILANVFVLQLLNGFYLILTHIKLIGLQANTKKLFPLYNKRVFNSEIEKLKEPDHFDCQTNYTILRRDIDTNLHVNNLNYLLFAYEALPKEVFDNSDFENIDIMYKKQCLLGDQIICFYTKISDNEHIITIKSHDLKILHSIIKLKGRK